MPTYKIKQGDTLSGLATQYKTDIPSLLKLNPSITDPNRISAGADLNLPDITPTPAVTTTDGIRRQAAEAGMKPAEVSTFRSEEEFKKFKETITPSSEKPSLPNLVSEYIKLREKYGVTPLEEKIISLKDEKTRLLDSFNKYKQTAGGAETIGIQRGRISEEAGVVQDELDRITRQEELATNQLNIKNSTISNVINLTKEDYSTTNEAWNTAFSQNLSLQNAFDSKADKEKTEARAVITTMQNFLKDSGVDFTKLDPTTKAQVQTLELQAGLPAGLFEFAHKVSSNKIQTVGSRIDINGNEFFDILRIKPDGTPYVETISRGGGSRGGGEGGTPGVTPSGKSISEYIPVVNNAANLLGADKAKFSRQNITRSLASGNYVSAYAEIANNVEQVLTGDVKSRFANARNDYTVMAGLRNVIQQYSDGGGDMGLLRGKEEEIKRKLGIDSGKASELATLLWREFQTYRNVMTGAAFGAAESRDYASVNPTLGKSLNLNLSVIDGAMSQLENRITSTIETRVPGAKKIYNQIKQETEMTDDEAYKKYLEAIKF